MVRKNKRAAMEMTVGTIVTIVLLMSALVLGLVLTKTIFSRTTDNVIAIDEQVKGEINKLFENSGSGLVIMLGNQNTARVKVGTANFGIPIAFSPKSTSSWGTGQAAGTGCKYTLNAATGTGTKYCNAAGGGWSTPCSSVKTGCGANQIAFETFENNIGYSLIKVDIPEALSPCLQRFTIKVTCGNIAAETTQQAFDIEVINKGLFS
jgi:hypothetical protein